MMRGEFQEGAGFRMAWLDGRRGELGFGEATLVLLCPDNPPLGVGLETLIQSRDNFQCARQVPSPRPASDDAHESGRILVLVCDDRGGPDGSRKVPLLGLHFCDPGHSCSQDCGKTFT
jgi:hypothetical protein